jgi:NAD-dependent histone deacetylase SIR2
VDGGRGEGEADENLKGVCGGLVKPDIVFFGEALPRAFFDSSGMAKEADLILVMGTSLQVHPFAGLPNMAEEETPRVLFNLEQVGSFGTRADDVMVLGDCDTGVRRLAEELGWRDELEKAWRELVGDEEAERQLQGATKRVVALHDEVSKLADEVEEVLHIGENESGSGQETKDTRPDHETPAAGATEDAEGGQGTGKGPAPNTAEPIVEPPEDKTNPSGSGHAENQSSAERGDKTVSDGNVTGKGVL